MQCTRCICVSLNTAVLFVMRTGLQVIVVNPSFFKYTHDRWTEHHGRYPSTGMLAIVFALHLCDEVNHLLTPDIYSKVASELQLSPIFGESPLTKVY